MRFHWTIDGTECPSSPGAMTRPASDSGEREAESVGQVLEWLLDHGPVWGLVDQKSPLAITITPVAPCEHYGHFTANGLRYHHVLAEGARVERCGGLG